MKDQRGTKRHLLLRYIAAVQERRDEDARRLFEQLWGEA